MVGIPLRKDIIIPLERQEAKKLVDKLRELIPAAKKRKFERTMKFEKEFAREMIGKHIG